MSGNIYNNKKIQDYAQRDKISKLIKKTEEYHEKMESDKSAIAEIREITKNLNNEISDLEVQHSNAITELRNKISSYVSKLQNTAINEEFTEQFEKLENIDTDRFYEENKPFLDSYIENQSFPQDLQYDDILSFDKNFSSLKHQLVYCDLFGTYDNEELMNKDYGFGEWEEYFKKVRKTAIKIPISSNLKTFEFGLTYKQNYSCNSYYDEEKGTEDNEYIVERFFTGKIFLSNCNSSSKNLEVRAVILSADSNPSKETDGVGPVIRLKIMKDSEFIYIYPDSIKPYRILPVLRKNNIEEDINKSTVTLIDIANFNTRTQNFYDDNGENFNSSNYVFVDRNDNKIEINDRIGLTCDAYLTLLDNSCTDEKNGLTTVEFVEERELDQGISLKRDIFEIKAAPTGLIQLIGFEYSNNDREDEVNVGATTEIKHFKNFKLKKNEELNKPIHKRTPSNFIDLFSSYFGTIDDIKYPEYGLQNKIMSEPYEGVGQFYRNFRIFNEDEEYYYGILEQDISSVWGKENNIDVGYLHHQGRQINKTPNYEPTVDGFGNSVYSAQFDNCSIFKNVESSRNPLKRIFTKEGLEVILFTQYNSKILSGMTNFENITAINDLELKGEMNAWGADNDTKFQSSPATIDFVYDAKLNKFYIIELNNSFSNALYRKKLTGEVESTDLFDKFIREFFKNCEPQIPLSYSLDDYSNYSFPNYSKSMNIYLSDKSQKSKDKLLPLFQFFIRDIGKEKIEMEFVGLNTSAAPIQTDGRGNYYTYSKSDYTSTLESLSGYASMYIGSGRKSKILFTPYYDNCISPTKNEISVDFVPTGIIKVDQRGSIMSKGGKFTFEYIKSPHGGSTSTYKFGHYIKYTNYNNYNKYGGFLYKLDSNKNIAEEVGISVSGAGDGDPDIHTHFLNNLPITRSPFIVDDFGIVIFNPLNSLDGENTFKINYGKKCNSVSHRITISRNNIGINRNGFVSNSSMFNKYEHSMVGFGSQPFNLNTKKRGMRFVYNKIFRIKKSDLNDIRMIKDYYTSNNVEWFGSEYINNEIPFQKLRARNDACFVSVYSDRFRNKSSGFSTFLVNGLRRITKGFKNNVCELNYNKFINHKSYQRDRNMISDSKFISYNSNFYLDMLKQFNPETIFNVANPDNNMKYPGPETYSFSVPSEYGIIYDIKNSVFKRVVLFDGHYCKELVNREIITEGENKGKMGYINKLLFYSSQSFIGEKNFAGEINYFRIFTNIYDSKKDLFIVNAWTCDLDEDGNKIADTTRVALFYTTSDTFLNDDSFEGGDIQDTSKWKKLEYKDFINSKKYPYINKEIIISTSYFIEEEKKLILFIDTEFYHYANMIKTKNEDNKNVYNYHTDKINQYFTHIIIDLKDLDNLSVEFIDNRKTFQPWTIREQNVLDIEYGNMKDIINTDCDGRYIVHPTNGIIYDFNDIKNIKPRKNQKINTTQVIYNEKRKSWLYITNTSYEDYEKYRFQMPIIQEVPSYVVELDNKTFINEILEHLKSSYEKNNNEFVVYKINVHLAAHNATMETEEMPIFSFTEFGVYNPYSFNNKIIRYVNKVIQDRDYKRNRWNSEDEFFNNESMDRYEKLYDSESLFKRMNLEDRKYLEIFFSKFNMKSSQLISQPLEGLDGMNVITSMAVAEVEIYPTRATFTNIDHLFTRNFLENFDAKDNPLKNNILKSWINGEEKIWDRSNIEDEGNANNPDEWKLLEDDIFELNDYDVVNSKKLKYSAIMKNKFITYAENNKIEIFDKNNKINDSLLVDIDLESINHIVSSNPNLYVESDLIVSTINTDEESKKGLFIYHNDRVYFVEFKDYLSEVDYSYEMDSKGFLWILNYKDSLWTIKKYKLSYVDRNFEIDEIESYDLPNAPSDDKKYYVQMNLEKMKDTISIVFYKSGKVYLLGLENNSRRLISHESLEYFIDKDKILTLSNTGTEIYSVDNKILPLIVTKINDEPSVLNTTFEVELIDPEQELVVDNGEGEEGEDPTEPIVEQDGTTIMTIDNYFLKMKIDEMGTINVTTDAEEIEVESTDPEIASVEKEEYLVKVTGKSKGQCFIKIKGTNVSGNATEKILSIPISIRNKDTYVDVNPRPNEIRVNYKKILKLSSNSANLDCVMSLDETKISKDGETVQSVEDDKIIFKTPITLLSEGETKINFEYKFDFEALDLYKKSVDFTINVAAEYNEEEQTPDGSTDLGEIISNEELKVSKLNCLKLLDMSNTEIDINTDSTCILFKVSKMISLRDNSILILGNNIDYKGNEINTNFAFIYNKSKKRIEKVTLPVNEEFINLSFRDISYNHITNEILIPVYGIETENDESTRKVIYGKINNKLIK